MNLLFKALFATFLLTYGEAGIAATALNLPSASMTWIIQPQDTDPSPVVVKPGHAFARTRVLPPTLYLLDEPAVLTDGTPLLTANTELAGLTGVARTGCTMRVPAVARTMKPASRLYSKSNRYLCLHDADADGRFDSYVWLYSATVTMLVGKWRWVPLEGRTVPVHYRVAEPATTQAAPWLYLVLINDAKWVGKVRLGGVLATGDFRDQRVPYTSYVADPESDVSIKSLPAKFGAFGGEFEVIGRTDGGLAIRTVKPIPEAPFTAGW